MPKRRKQTQTPEGLTTRLVLPLVALLLAVAGGVVAVASGLRAMGAPMLGVMPIDGVVLVTTPLLAGMLLLRAANGRVTRQRALTAVSLLVVAFALAASGIALFGAGFRRYVRQRATTQELQTAVGDLLDRQKVATRAAFTLRDLPADAPALEPIRRLRPNRVRTDRGAGAKDSEVYLGWGASVFSWGIRVKGSKLEYRYGE